MDKPTATAAIAKRLAGKIARELTWAQFASAVTGLDADGKAALLKAVQGQQATQIGNLLLGYVRDHVRSLALAEADTILADDVVSLAELDKVI